MLTLVRPTSKRRVSRVRSNILALSLKSAKVATRSRTRSTTHNCTFSASAGMPLSTKFTESPSSNCVGISFCTSE